MYKISKKTCTSRSTRVCGLMDKAPDFGSGDCRFESCHARKHFVSNVMEYLKISKVKKESINN